MLDRNQLLGAWELKNHGIRDESGTFSETSSFLLGRLIYEPSGAMSVLIALKNPVEKTSDLIAYSGRFSIKGQSVFHHVEVASRSNRVGETEERLAELCDEILILRTPPDDSGIYEISWKRIR